METNDVPKQQTIITNAVEATMQDKMALFMVWWTDSRKNRVCSDNEHLQWRIKKKLALSAKPSTPSEVSTALVHVVIHESTRRKPSRKSLMHNEHT